MRIGIEARIFSSASFGGIARSVYNIISSWMDDYPQHEYFLIGFNPLVIDESKLPANWHVVIRKAKINKGAVWSRLVLPKIIKELRLDVYWGTSYTLPPKVKNVKMILTIYDLSLLHFKGIGQRKTEIGIKLFGKSNCKKADKIVAISEATKKDIIDTWGIKNEKIVVSYCGGPQAIRARDLVVKEGNNVKDTITRPYCLFVGTFEPRKNIPTIIRAFEEYARGGGESTDLILCGKRGWRCENIYEMIEQSVVKDRIKVFGYINDEEKEYLIHNARAFLYPSLYEGFGIPVLEAMQQGVPVITANNSSLPEVGGDAAFYIQNVLDYKELASMMETVLALSADELKELQKKMKAQTQRFSWRKNAEEIMSIMEGLLGKG